MRILTDEEASQIRDRIARLVKRGYVEFNYDPARVSAIPGVFTAAE